MKPRYRMTRAELAQSCPLLKSIEVTGGGSEQEALVGRNQLGEVCVLVKGKVTPERIERFSNSYQDAVRAGIIKPAPKEAHVKPPE